MTVEQKIAKALVRNMGYELALEQTKSLLDLAMVGSSIKDIEMQHLWRETLVEIMKTRH